MYYCKTKSIKCSMYVYNIVSFLGVHTIVLTCCWYSFLQKLFVLLLHFPAMMFYEPCYPSLFLPGWDHYYLDTIDQSYNSSLVDTKWVTDTWILWLWIFIGNGSDNLVYMLRNLVLHLMIQCVNSYLQFWTNQRVFRSLHQGCTVLCVLVT